MWEFLPSDHVIASVVAVVGGLLLLLCAIIALCCRRRRSPAQKEQQGAGGQAENRLIFHTAECSVCLDRFEDNQKVVRLNCGHIFHEDCIRSCLRMRNACPLCNTGDARATMQNAQVALLNDPARLHQINSYISQVFKLSSYIMVAGGLLAEYVRPWVIAVFIRGFINRRLYNWYNYAGRVMTFLITFFVEVVTHILAVWVSIQLQLGLEIVFTAFGSLSMLEFCEHLGVQLLSYFTWPFWCLLFVVVLVSYRASTINPAPLMGEFRPENTYIISGQSGGQAAIEEDVVETEGMARDNVVEVEGTESAGIADVIEEDTIQHEKMRSCCCLDGCYTMFTTVFNRTQ